MDKLTKLTEGMTKLTEGMTKFTEGLTKLTDRVKALEEKAGVSSNQVKKRPAKKSGNSQRGKNNSSKK